MDDVRSVSLSPKAMVDSVADWPLHQVVEHLRKKEKEDTGDVEVDCRLFHTSGIRMFSTIVDELADNYDVSRGRMCRWLSYHGVEMAKQDKVISDLQTVFSATRKLALEGDSHSITDIRENVVPYSPIGEDGKRVSFYVYNSWVLSDFTKLGQMCGVSPAQAAQVYMIRSILTCDLPALSGVAARLQAESNWWSKWMRYRVNALEIAVSMWGDK